MTLQFQNIRYDHSQESRIFEKGVFSIDTNENRLHLHDGVTPNGISLPIMLDLTQFANKSLSNVTQQDITNMLSNYGALNVNSSAPLTDAQRNNMFGKLYMDALKTGQTFPDSNFVRMNKANRQMIVQDTGIIPCYFPCIDASQPVIARSQDVTYTATRHCCVIIECTGNNSEFLNFYVDDVLIKRIFLQADRAVSGTFTEHFFVASGCTYKATGRYAGSITTFKEYGIKKLTF